MLVKDKWVGYIFHAALLCMLLALASYAYMGTFTRYMADDYCTAATVRNMDFWSAQSYWWQNWSGRYSFTFTILSAELLGVGLVPILPTLIIILWVFSIVWAILPFLKKLKVGSYISSAIFIAGVVLWLTYRSVDDYPQVVFWQTGILTYPITPVLFLLGVGIAIRRAANSAPLTWPELFSWLLFAFVAGGFSETGVVMQIALITVLYIYLRLTNEAQSRLFAPILWATFLGSVLSLLTIALAPGNVVRANGFTDIPTLNLTIPGFVRGFLLFIPSLVDRHTIPFIFGFLAGIFLVYFCLPDDIRPNSLSIGQQFLASFVIVEVGVSSGIAPSYVLNGVLPQERVLLFSYFLVACLVMYWGALSALFVRLKLPVATRGFQISISLGLFVAFIAWSVVPVVISRLQLIAPLRVYSTIWDERHQSMLMDSRNGASILVAEDFMKVEALHELRTKVWISGDFETGANYWINRCGADYYQVDQVIAE